MPRGNREDIHHVSAHFGKSRVVVSVKPQSTLADLKGTLFSALPQLLSHAPFSSSSSSPGASTSSSLPPPKDPGDILLFTPRTNDEGERIGWVSLEGGAFPSGQGGEDGAVDVDEEGEGVQLDDKERKEKLGRQLKDLGWEKWVDVFLSFRGADGTFRLPVVTLPTLEEDEGDIDAEMEAAMR